MIRSSHRSLLGGSVATVLFLLSNLPFIAFAGQPKLCMMMYMVADNNLEPDMFEDLMEYFSSDAMYQPNVNTWIYWDSHGGYDYDGDGEGDHPQSLIWESADAPLFMTFDHSIQDITVIPLEGEQNSDTPGILWSFLTVALKDCLSFGATEFMLILSAHGGGHQGFGGDENTGRRHLLQANHDIQLALECGLDSVAELPNAPSVFDVIGFDACLMGSFLATRDYSPFAKYFMASEAIEPAHGWMFNVSSSAANGALSMATELFSGFLTETQNGDGPHLVPKTLSIVDTNSFEIFLTEFETLVNMLADLLWSETDQAFFAAMQRSRAASTAFESGADDIGSKTPSAVDIGSFLSTFNELCAPTGAIKEALDRTLEAYDAQFYARGFGEGTKPSSGMATWFPSKKLHSEQPWLFESEVYGHVLADNETSWEWIDFLGVFLNSTTPYTNQGPSICANTFTSSIKAKTDNQLLLNPDVYLVEGGIEASSDIAIQTDLAYTEYGFYFDVMLRRRLLVEGLSTTMIKQHTPITPIGRRIKQNRLIGSKAKSTATRRSVQEDAYLVLFNGAMPFFYDGPTYYGFWDKKVYVLLENTEEGGINFYVYADDHGEGSFSMPVIYFAEGVGVSANNLPPMGSFVDDAIALGGVYAELEWAIDVETGVIISPISLYTSLKDGGAIYETSRSQGGSIVPVVYGELGFEDDFAFVEYVGTLHPWDDNLSVVPIDLGTYSASIGQDEMVFDIYAFDLDKADGEDGSLDYALFSYNITEGNIYADGGTETVTGASTPTSVPSETENVGARTSSSPSCTPARVVTPLLFLITILVTV